MRETESLRRPGKSALPTISDYIDALRNPYGRFRTLGEPESRTNTRGEILFYAGNNSAVFPAAQNGNTITIKCYIKNRLHAEKIYSYICAADDSLLTPARLLTEEIYVYDIFGQGCYHDIVAADWVDGITLETAIARAARRDGYTFGELSESFDDMSLRLLAREWAHGDLKPENIIVRPDRSLCLIDYDAMFVPDLTGSHTLETGTPQYQHPARGHTVYDKSIDDYPIALISVSLRALAVEPALYDRYNHKDNIIMYPSDILNDTSEPYRTALQLFARRGDHASYNLALALRSPSPRIPNLSELLTSRSSCSQMSMTQVVEPGHPATSELSPFPDDDGLWGYRDTEGRTVIPAVYQTANRFSDGMAVVRIDGIWQVIDPSGAMILDCSQYDAVKPFSDGLAPVCRDGKWGFITVDGTVAVEPRYEMAGILREGFAVIKLGGRYGYADGSGKIAAPPVYDYATGFRNGKATVSIDGQTFEIEYPDPE